MSEEKTVVIVGMPVAEAGAEVCAGSKQYDCSLCGCPVWIAPSGQTLIAAGCMVVCLPCGRRLMKETDAKVAMLPENASEVAEHLARKRRK